MASSEILGLQWLEHPNIFNQAIIGLRNKGSFTDATLACEGRFYPVHKFVLSTCSEYFNAIFEWTPCVNPVIVINNISSHNLERLLDFMYRGETNVQECHIQDVMKAAEWLHIKGLSLRPEGSILARNRTKSPSNVSEPRKRYKRSETSRKKAPYSKLSYPAENIDDKQNLSSLHSSPIIPSSTTQPVVLAHQPSPHHSPLIHSPSVKSSSPLALSSATSSPLNPASSYPVPLQIPSPKSLLTPPLSMGNQVQSQQVKNISSFSSDTTSSSTSQSQNISRQCEMYSSHGRNQFCLKDEQSSLGLTCTINAASSTESTVLAVPNDCGAQFRKCPVTVPDQIIHGEGIHHNVCRDSSQTLSNLDPKIIGIGEELHLEGPVKELQISTEDGTVSIPEILEGLVDMRHLYDSKNDAVTHDTKSSGMEYLSQCSSGTSETPSNFLPFKDEANDSMYEFTEEFQENAGMERMKLLKEKAHKVYSNSGSNMKRKFSLELSSTPQPPSPKLSSGSGEASRGASLNSSPPPLHPADAETGEEKGTFVCVTCSRTFKKKESLTRHLRTHMEFPYQCTVCLHKCKEYKEFIIHRKTHATKRCDKCDFVTIRNDNLRRHMITHSEDKNHKCSYPECSYSTSRANLLSSHVQNHHTKKKCKKEDK